MKARVEATERQKAKEKAFEKYGERVAQKYAEYRLVYSYLWHTLLEIDKKE